MDWFWQSSWKPRMSSTRRSIKLLTEASQEAYDLLAELLFEKFMMQSSGKAVCQPDARDDTV